MFELSSAQWKAWEQQVKEDLVERALDGWRRHFPNPARRFGHVPPEQALRAWAAEILRACERKGIDDAATVTAIILLAWHSAALGLNDACITDCLHFAIYEYDGTTFAIQWWEHFLRKSEAALHAPNPDSRTS